MMRMCAPAVSRSTAHRASRASLIIVSYCHLGLEGEVPSGRT
jgi:hypothetical protein